MDVLKHLSGGLVASCQPVDDGPMDRPEIVAAMAMACRPDEQKRLTVAPDVVDGQPAQRAALRATLWPVAPSGWAVPRNTSSIRPASMPARSMALLMAWPAMVMPWVSFRLPRLALAMPVRA